MNEHTTQLIENARTWLANPKNANHQDRSEIQQELNRLNGAPRTGRAEAGADPEAALAGEVLVTLRRFGVIGEAPGAGDRPRSRETAILAAFS